ncbi:MAG: hypothetical protein AAGO57_04235, partial [Pseudomonadota bacterium]
VWLLPLSLIVLVSVSVRAVSPTHTQIIPENFGEFDLGPFLYFATWFGIGALLFHHREVLDRLARWPVIAGLLVVAGVSLVAVWNDQRLLGAVSSLAWVLAFLGLAHRLLTSANWWVSWLIELSYPIYLLHILPAIFLGVLFVNLGLPQILAIPLNIVATFVISVVGYYVLIKFTPLNWVVNGYKKSWLQFRKPVPA